MELVPTTLAHIPFARRLLASIDITRHTYFRITAEYLDDASLSAWLLLRKFRRFCAVENGVCVGMVVFEPHGATASWSFLLSPEFRGNGYGKTMASLSLLQARKMGFSWLRMEVQQPNPASAGIVQKHIGARPFQMFELKLPFSDPLMNQMRLPTRDGGSLEARPTTLFDMKFFRTLFANPEIQRQVYADVSFSTASDEEALTFLLGHSDARWTLWRMPENRPVGTIHLYEREGPFSNFGMAILPSEQGQGLGRTALLLLEGAAKADGIRILRGDVFLDNVRMQKIITDRGFRPYSFFEKYLFDEPTG
jgi:RimJ/RimL family protein N-acetyltransferase